MTTEQQGPDAPDWRSERWISTSTIEPQTVVEAALIEAGNKLHATLELIWYMADRAERKGTDAIDSFDLKRWIENDSD